MSIYDEPNPDAEPDVRSREQVPFVLQRPPKTGANIIRILWNLVVAFLLLVALLAAVAGGALLGGVGGGLIALAVSFAYLAHLIESAVS